MCHRYNQHEGYINLEQISRNILQCICCGHPDKQWEYNTHSPTNSLVKYKPIRALCQAQGTRQRGERISIKPPHKLVSGEGLGLSSQSQTVAASSDWIAWVGQMGGSVKAGPAQCAAAAEAIWKSGMGLQGLTMRWRKVLSPLGLLGRAVICTTANRSSVRGAALSFLISCPEIPLAFAILTCAFRHSPQSIPFYSFSLAASGLFSKVPSLWFSWLLLPLCLSPRHFPFSCQTKCTNSGRNQILLSKRLLIFFFLHMFWITVQRFYNSHRLELTFQSHISNPQMWSLDVSVLLCNSTVMLALFWTVSSTAWETVMDVSHRKA